MSNNVTHLPGIDRLSEMARAALRVNAANAYTKLFVAEPGNGEAHGLLSALTTANVLSAASSNPAEAAGVLAGLWLWHDFLGESHKIAQSLATPSGSMWHAIMHRREGDFSNSK